MNRWTHAGDGKSNTKGAKGSGGEKLRERKRARGRGTVWTERVTGRVSRAATASTREWQRLGDRRSRAAGRDGPKESMSVCIAEASGMAGIA